MSLVYDPAKGGVFNDAAQFAPGPGTIFRRQAVLDAVARCGPAAADRNDPVVRSYLGVGCGTAAIDYEFFQMGYSCTVTDWSREALDNVEKIYNEEETVFACKSDTDESDIGRYDVLGAYEVLEHAQDDEATLREWAALLKSGGMIVLSVPAHMKHWSRLDEVGGHYRRYEGDDLKALLERCGFEDICIESVGYPVLTLFWPLGIRSRFKLFRKNKAMTMEAKTRETGLIVSKQYRLHRFIPYRIITALAKTQRPFYNKDTTFDYVVAAKKK